MAADLRLVADAAEADAHELAARAPRRSSGPRLVLPTPGGPTKQRIGLRMLLLRELAHRHVLEDALLHLRQAVVVAVEHLRAASREVEVVVGRFVHGSVTSQSR